MAKGGNLLDDDDADDGSFDDYGDDLDGGLSQSGSAKKKGGGLVKTIGIVLVALLVFGGGGWAGYQYWWIPRQLKKQRIAEAKKKQIELKRKNAAKIKKANEENKKRAMALYRKRQSDAAKLKKIADNTTASSGGAMAVSPVPTKADGKKKAQPARAVPAKTMAKEVPSEASAKSTRTARRIKRMASREKQKKRPAPPRTLKKGRRAATPRLPRRTSRKRIRSSSTASERTAKKGSAPYYSVQIATCRTDKCVRSFVDKLRAKGYRPFVSGRSKSSSSSKRTEVLLGDFAAKPDALFVASRARAKKIRVSVYKTGGKWLVSAGSYADLEDAAQRMDIVEDSGLQARLAPRTTSSTKPGLRAVRIGKLSSRREARDILRRVSKAGFRGSYVVRRK